MWSLAARNFDLLPGTNVDEFLIGLVGLLVLLTVFAAAARKPPLIQIGRFIGWIFRRLIGDPLGGWMTKHFDQQVRPIVREEVEAAVEPIKGSVADIAKRVSDHEENCERRERLLDRWRQAMVMFVSNLSKEEAPHLPPQRADEIKGHR